MEPIFVNTNTETPYYVEIDAIKKSIQQIFEDSSDLVSTSEINIKPNKTKSNFRFSLSYKAKNSNSFLFETKKLIFLIEQKVYSLIDNKPININLIFEGFVNEKK
ncbi:hypothetical protein FJO69_01585 [[Mycoplasma] falconis]|uniref:Uncharacterized protein n=1 Tax=[Mycoplasma] falconis TaxID=92403 RepID=A0A501XA46_9BACT|nr:hypothetical protein [[Mycoplasma] falconis]TPE57425.1 hypothetical protein FJO69_01585 [[Mycoplasma] falconis]